MVQPAELEGQDAHLCIHPRSAAWGARGVEEAGRGPRAATTETPAQGPWAHAGGKSSASESQGTEYEPFQRESELEKNEETDYPGGECAELAVGP